MLLARQDGHYDSPSRREVISSSPNPRQNQEMWDSNKETGHQGFRKTLLFVVVLTRLNCLQPFI